MWRISAQPTHPRAAAAPLRIGIGIGGLPQRFGGRWLRAGGWGSGTIALVTAFAWERAATFLR